jgi:hypothetical protein
VGNVSLNEVGPTVKDLIADLRPGEEVGVFEAGLRIATIRKEIGEFTESYPCKAVSANGKVIYIADDFDSPLDDFSKYMQ